MNFRNVSLRILYKPVRFVFLNVSVFSGPVAGMLSERFGERPIAILGTTLASIGLALCSLSSQVRNRPRYHYPVFRKPAG